jgi:hypothetical protein
MPLHVFAPQLQTLQQFNQMLLDAHHAVEHHPAGCA